MAHKKGAGSTRNGRDSAGQRLGVKEYAGARVDAGTIKFGYPVAILVTDKP